MKMDLASRTQAGIQDIERVVEVALAPFDTGSIPGLHSANLPVNFLISRLDCNVAYH